MRPLALLTTETTRDVWHCHEHWPHAQPVLPATHLTVCSGRSEVAAGVAGRIPKDNESDRQLPSTARRKRTLRRGDAGAQR